MTDFSAGAAWVILLAASALCVTALALQHRYLREKHREPSSETWFKAREKKERGDFRRRFKRRVAINFHEDEFELECGHRYPATDKEPRPEYDCRECLDAWVKAEVRAGR